MTVTGTLTWLGGGLSAPRAATDPAVRQESAGYVLTGTAVLLFAVVSGAVTAAALAAADGVAGFVVVLGALVACAATGAIGRALVTGRAGDRTDRVARIAVAVLAGALVAELGSTVLLGATVDRALDQRAQSAAESAPAVVTARAEHERAVADRAALDQTIGRAQGEIDRALVTARCEYNPTPECPQTRITGVPGRGPESRTAEAMLDDARKQLTAAQDRVAPLDTRVTETDRALATARAAAFAEGDRGLGARWVALNDHTLDHPGALALRLLVLAAGVLLAVAPLLLRRWRGETALDRAVTVAEVTDRAEREADAAIAIKRAETRAEAETLRAEAELASTRLAVHADSVIDQERQRTRIIAAVGGFEIGITDRKDNPVALEGNASPAALPAAYLPNALPQAGTTGGALVPAPLPQPQPVITEGVPVESPRPGGLALPIIGQVPFTDTAARWIRPLVPSFVANAIDTATHPLRTARQAFEEVEEVTFTLRRSRKVTVNSEDSGAQAVAQQLPPGYAVPGYPQLPGRPAPGYAGQGYAAPNPVPPQADPYAAQYARQLASSVVDAPGAVYHPDPRQYPSAPQHPGLPAAPQAPLTAAEQAELSGPGTGELPGRRGPRALPPGR
ncbi:DUF4407 domain-containing protein [Nocardia thailandica]|uniref:DUF4407 domain-containing protein n=1 Tax=Nocardia thailandica TaxID=257275 RepID=A0ABW6PGG7_9NOCA